MGFLDWFRPQPPSLQTRQLDVPIDTQLTRIWQARQGVGPPSVRAAMGVPAVYRAVTLISSLTASLPLDTYRLGELVDPTDAPPVVRRPDPFESPQAFVRQTALNLASWGEAFWWIASRDVDGLPTSVVNLHPPEVTVRWDDQHLRAVVEWRGTDITRDVEHLAPIRLGDSPRGVGPLQLCGGVMTAATEATEWAARFMSSGGTPSVVLDTPAELTAAEAESLKAAWTSTPSNMPKVTSGGIKATPFGLSPKDAQLVDVREQSVGEVARMFGLPGYLLGARTEGSSLTYANVGDVATELLRLTLVPSYLGPIEQAFTELLPRTMAVRFRAAAIERADIRTRFDTYASGIASGVLTVDEAQAMEFASDITSPPNRRANVTGVPTP